MSWLCHIPTWQAVSLGSIPANPISFLELWVLLLDYFFHLKKSLNTLITTSYNNVVKIRGPPPWTELNSGHLASEARKRPIWLTR